MSNPFETPPSQPPKPAVEVPSQELLRAESPTPDTSAAPERMGGMTPEQTEHAERMLRPVQDPTANAARRKEAKDRQPLNPDRNGPVVPYTVEEMAAAERRYDAGWEEPLPPPSPGEVPQKEREKEELENLRKVIDLMDQFELQYPLQELHAITYISLAELVEHPVRKPANAALVHIRKAIGLIKSIPEIDEHYRRLSQAVGTYNSISKTLDHDRG